MDMHQLTDIFCQIDDSLLLTRSAPLIGKAPTFLTFRKHALDLDNMVRPEGLIRQSLCSFLTLRAEGSSHFFST